MVELTSRVFRVQKDGNAPEDCEDAHAAAEETCRFAVADGASDSFRAGSWASALVTAFVSDPIEDAAMAGKWLEPLQQSWKTAVDEDWATLPWYKQSKARRGSHATLLGFEVDSRQWRATAVGDTCLFHVRGNTILSTFPFDRADQFDTTPDLISTEEAGNGRVTDTLKVVSGACEYGDCFVLATDALACWALSVRDADGWRILLDLREDAAFTELVDDLRRSGAMRNDDVTLMVIEILASDGQPAAATHETEP